MTPRRRRRGSSSTSAANVPAAAPPRRGSARGRGPRRRPARGSTGAPAEAAPCAGRRPAGRARRCARRGGRRAGDRDRAGTTPPSPTGRAAPSPGRSAARPRRRRARRRVPSATSPTQSSPSRSSGRRSSSAPSASKRTRTTDDASGARDADWDHGRQSGTERGSERGRAHADRGRQVHGRERRPRSARRRDVHGMVGSHVRGARSPRRSPPHGYLPDEGLATAVFLAVSLRRPLLLEGEAGVGKTELAKVLATWTGGELIRLQCYEGIDAAQAVYDWDYGRQLLHLRAAEASGESAGRSTDALEAELYQERFLVKRALLRAIEPRRGPAAGAARRRDRPRRRRVRGVPAGGAVRLADHGPRARRVPRRPAAARRADQQPHPRRARRAQAALPVPLGRAPRLRSRGGHRPPARAGGRRGARPPGRRRRRGAARPHRCTSRRASPRPSTGRRALGRLGVTELDEQVVAATLGTVLKYREDHERVEQHGFADIVKQAFARAAGR